MRWLGVAAGAAAGCVVSVLLTLSGCADGARSANVATAAAPSEFGDECIEEYGNGVYFIPCSSGSAMASAVAKIRAKHWDVRAIPVIDGYRLLVLLERTGERVEKH